MIKKELIKMMKNVGRVSIRDINRPISEYPKGTVFVQDHDDIVIPLPTKEQIEKHKQKHQNQEC